MSDLKKYLIEREISIHVCISIAQANHPEDFQTIILRGKIFLLAVKEHYKQPII